MANIVFVTNFTGHLNATFKLAGDLRKRGHNVAYVGAEEARPAIVEQGFAFASVRYIRDLPADEKPRNLFKRRHSLRAVAEQTLDGVRDIPVLTDQLVHQLKPDLLIFDPFYLIYAIPFYPHRIPALALSTKPLLDPDPIVPPYTSRLVPIEFLSMVAAGDVVDQTMIAGLTQAFPDWLSTIAALVPYQRATYASPC